MKYKTSEKEFFVAGGYRVGNDYFAKLRTHDYTIKFVLRSIVNGVGWHGFGCLARNGDAYSGLWAENYGSGNYNFSNKTAVLAVLKDNSQARSYCFSQSGSKTYCYDGLMESVVETDVPKTGIGNNVFFDSDYSKNDGKHFMIWSSFMVYDRALSREEVLHNYAIDKARFGLT